MGNLPIHHFHLSLSPESFELILVSAGLLAFPTFVGLLIPFHRNNGMVEQKPSTGSQLRGQLSYCTKFPFNSTPTEVGAKTVTAANIDLILGSKRQLHVFSAKLSANTMIKQYLFLLILISSACKSPNKPLLEKSEQTENYIRYATQFKVQFGEGYKLIEIPQAWKDAQQRFQYLLIERGRVIPSGFENIPVIEIPLQRIACTSTSHLPTLEMLGVEQSLVGFAQSDFVSSKKIRARIDEGAVQELGSQHGLNIESVVALNPEILMAFSMGNESPQLKQLQQMGIPVIFNADYLEQDPLARAEWIKFTALFYNKEKEADSIFTSIENRYMKLKSLAANVQIQPKVFCGLVYGDIWYTPGGKSWASTFLNHAGADYLWKNTDATGSLELSFESVFEVASKADLWIGVANFTTLNELKAANERYTFFEAFNKGNVFTYNARMGARGGNDYLESGYLRPDLVLADLIKIIHPELLPEHVLYYYRQLQ